MALEKKKTSIYSKKSEIIQYMFTGLKHAATNQITFCKQKNTSAKWGCHFVAKSGNYLLIE